MVWSDIDALDGQAQVLGKLQAHHTSSCLQQGDPGTGNVSWHRDRRSDRDPGAAETPLAKALLTRPAPARLCGWQAQFGVHCQRCGHGRLRAQRRPRFQACFFIFPCGAPAAARAGQRLQRSCARAHQLHGCACLQLKGFLHTLLHGRGL